MPYAQLSKLTLKDMGEPAIIKTLPETTRELLLGTLYGKANDFCMRSKPDKTEEFEGLVGNFRIIPVDINGQVREDQGKESAILFIPEAFHNAIADQLRKAKGVHKIGTGKSEPIPDAKRDDGAEIMFIYDVSVIRAKNPQGYSWSFMPAKEYTKSPLEELVLEHRAMKAKQIENTAAPRKIVGGNK